MSSKNSLGKHVYLDSNNVPRTYKEPHVFGIKNTEQMCVDMKSNTGIAGRFSWSSILILNTYVSCSMKMYL